MRKLVSIISDWKNSDYYLGSLKAAVISQVSNLEFVDISHSIDAFNHIQAAFILRSVYKKFPDGTIHILAVNTELGKNERFIVAVYHNQYFIANDNGSLGLIFDNKPELAVVPDTGIDFPGSTFPELSIFSNIIPYIVNGGDIKELGDVCDDVNRKSSLLPQIEPGEINANVIYIDSYENAICNFTKEMFAEHIGDKDFEISLENSNTKIRKISPSYKNVETGNILCLFNSLGLLEIAVREGRAASLFNISSRSQIRIRFGV